MSERRAARGSAPAAVQDVGGLPPELAAGPCIEDWCDAAARRKHELNSSVGWFRAMRAWQAAVDEWAIATGWATARRPASNARNLARTRTPWSRAFLLARDEADLIAYFEGRRSTRPARRDKGWNPLTGPIGNEIP